MRFPAPPGPAALPRRSWPVALALLPVLALAGCGDPRPAPAGATAAQELDFRAKHPIPVRLDLRSSADGGRQVPLAGAWRGRFAFAGAAGQVQCGLHYGEERALEPGTSHELRLLCNAAVALPDDGRRGFRVFEDGREIGSGVVLP